MTLPNPSALLLASLVTHTALSVRPAHAQEVAPSRFEVLWRALKDADREQRALILDDLRREPAAAAREGVRLLREDDELRWQGHAFAITEMGPPGFDALLTESLDRESPARALAFEGLLFYRQRRLGDDPERERRSDELDHAIVKALDARTSETLRQISFGISSVDDDMRARIEARLGEPAPIGPRAALYMTRQPRPPRLAVIAALKDPLQSIRESALGRLLHWGDSEALAIADQFARGLYGSDRLSATVMLATATKTPWTKERAALLRAILTSDLPGPRSRDWYEVMQARHDIVSALGRRVAAEPGAPTDPDGPIDPDDPRALLLLVLEQPLSSIPWIDHALDGQRITALRPFLTGGAPLPERVTAALLRLAKRDEPSLPVVETVYLAQLRHAPPPAEERLVWAARYRSAIEFTLQQRPERPDSYQNGVAIAAAFDALGRLGHRPTLPYLLEQIRSAPVAGSAAAGAALRLGGGDDVVLDAIRDHFGRGFGKWPHDEVLAEAAADCITDDKDIGWLAQGLVERATQVPKMTANRSADVLAAVARLARKAQPGIRARIRDDLLRRFRDEPRGRFARPFAHAAAAIDPEAALAARDEPGIGQSLFLAVLRASPERIVRELDSPREDRRRSAHSVLENERMQPAMRATFAELLERPTLHDEALVLETLAGIGADESLIEHLAPRLGKQKFALQALVSIGPAAVPVLERTRLEFLHPGDLRLLHRLGPAGAPLIPLLLEHPEPYVRETAPLTLPFFGREGIAALRRLETKESELQHLLASVLRRSSAHPEARIAAADELLLMPNLEGIGRFRLVGNAPEELQTRMFLLQSNQDPHGDHATIALLDALAAADPALRAFAIRRLKDHPDRERVDRFIQWLREDPAPAVQRALQAYDR